MPDSAMGRPARKLSILIILVAVLSFAMSDLGTTRAGACTSSCRQECVQAYTYCVNHPGGFFLGCNFGRDCGTTTSASRCDSEECCSQYRYWCGYEQSPQTGYCWSHNCL